MGAEPRFWADISRLDGNAEKCLGVFAQWLVHVASETTASSDLEGHVDVSLFLDWRGDKGTSEEASRT